ncbi:hypothetical protein REMIM1_PE00084 (plasmid) [Rhizobium etli bv. mimosae str. Mim1]|nr:hypothetical protein REMIM1_PE00084 [Rhizobium etli bv. mimosae str. Mim1]
MFEHCDALLSTPWKGRKATDRPRAENELRQHSNDVLRGDGQRQILRPHERRAEGTLLFQARQSGAQAEIRTLAERQVRVVRAGDIEPAGVATDRPNV